jgi:ACR3 family arsenite efflux pump ArsB
MNTVIITALLLVVIAYQVYVTVRVVKSDQYSPTQRMLQIALVWLVPVVGAAICHVVLFTDQSTQKRDDRFIPATDENPPGIGQDALHR